LCSGHVCDLVQYQHVHYMFLILRGQLITHSWALIVVVASLCGHVTNACPNITWKIVSQESSRENWNTHFVPSKHSL